MMDDRHGHNDKTPDLAGRTNYGRSWGIPGVIAAVVLIAGVLVFSAAGSDRNRAHDNLNAPQVSTGLSSTGNSRAVGAKIPNTEMPTAPHTP